MPTVTARSATGTFSSGTAAVGAVTVDVPAGTIDTDLCVLGEVAKPHTTTLPTPTGWTKIAEITNGTVAIGADVGSVKTALYVRTGLVGGTSVAVAQTGADVLGAGMVSFQKPAGTVWNTSVFATGTDTTNAANYSATAGNTLQLAVGDRLLTCNGVNSDAGVGTVTSVSMGGLNGATPADLIARVLALFTTGNDAGLLMIDEAISAGAGAATPVQTWTNASAASGSTIFLRLRAAAPTALVGNQSVQRASNW